MKSNPILDEVWRIKAELAREAGYDVDRFFENLRAWPAADPPSGPVVRNVEELRRLADAPTSGTTALAFKEKAPNPQGGSMGK